MRTSSRRDVNATHSRTRLLARTMVGCRERRDFTFLRRLVPEGHGCGRHDAVAHLWFSAVERLCEAIMAGLQEVRHDG